jgi:3-oxoadipate enol-lactonase
VEVFEVNGVRLAANVAGREDGTPLVLLHGAGFDKSTWDAITPAFAATHRTYAVDLRGFGESGRPGMYSFEAMRDDLLNLLDMIGAERFDLIGHSMGATVAWLIAEELAQRQPDRIAHLVIEDSPPPRPGRERRDLGARPDPEPPFDWDAIVAIVDQLNDPDPRWWDGIRTVTAPILLLAGGSESYVPQQALAEALALLHDGRMVEIGVGHHIHRDAPGRFLAPVTDFLVGPVSPP